MIVDLERTWLAQAACAGKDTEEFFWPPTGQRSLHSPTPATQRVWDRVKEVCRTCPVMRQCARDFLGEVDGVWGGLDPAQREMLRKSHVNKIKALPDTNPVKQEYGALIHELHQEQKLPYTEIARIVGLTTRGAGQIGNWYERTLAKAEVVQEAEQEVLADVIPIPPREVVWPTVPPRNGDSWVWYCGRVVRAYYLGQTEDDTWFLMRVALGQDSSTGWFKAEDVKAMTTSHRVLERVGETSRVYGTTISSRRAAKAG